ncbi:hypothetical protein [Jatrophihabitans sp.]|uniref:hypothetical protein n=1 Tax=Jatrophihabitans sp. TaxID=1932789 RepID=UPI0030C682E0|nr:hypothetical protein [Jatrophihabitans sp.]
MTALAALQTVGCSRCETTAERPKVNGLITDPAGWSVVTVTSRPLVNRTLCPDCTEDVQMLLATAPGQPGRHAAVSA